MSNTKSYSVGVTSNDEWSSVPEVAQFVIAEDDAKEIIRLAKLVQENELYKVEKFDYRVSYYITDPDVLADEESTEGDDTLQRTDADCLCVSSDQFWFSALEKHGSVEFNTDHLEIHELAEHFGLEFSGRRELQA